MGCTEMNDFPYISNRGSVCIPNGASALGNDPSLAVYRRHSLGASAPSPERILASRAMAARLSSMASRPSVADRLVGNTLNTALTATAPTGSVWLGAVVLVLMVALLGLTLLPGLQNPGAEYGCGFGHL